MPSQVTHFLFQTDEVSKGNVQFPENITLQSNIRDLKQTDTAAERRRSTSKGPVKLIKQVKIANSFLQSVSNQFHVIILSLPT